MLVSIINVGTATVERTAIQGSLGHPRSTDSFINGIEVGLGFIYGVERVTTVMSVHIERCISIENDFPLCTVQGLSVDNDWFHIKFYLHFFDTKLSIF